MHEEIWKSRKAAIFNLFHVIAHMNSLLKFCSTPKIYIFLLIWPKLGINLIHSQWTAIVLAVIFLFDNLREKRFMSLIKLSGTACFKNSCPTWVENHWSKGVDLLGYHFVDLMSYMVLQFASRHLNTFFPHG